MSKQTLNHREKKSKGIYQHVSSIKTAKSINFVFLSLLLNWKAKFNRKIMPFEFPCHHVVSMRNICGIAKWPIDKTPTPSDVLFSIPLRQNQNNRAVANKNKITFPKIGRAHV